MIVSATGTWRWIAQVICRGFQMPGPRCRLGDVSNGRAYKPDYVVFRLAR